MEFDRHFPRRGAKGSETLLLETNYRSIEPVIRDGEAVLAGVRFKQAKTSRPNRPMQPGDHGVRLVTGFELNGGLAQLVAEIKAQCAHVVERGSRERTAVLLLGRRNDTLRAIQAELDRKLPVKAYTIHRAKGLQAEVAIVVDDCLPPQPHRCAMRCMRTAGSFATAMTRRWPTRVCAGLCGHHPRRQPGALVHAQGAGRDGTVAPARLQQQATTASPSSSDRPFQNSSGLRSSKGGRVRLSSAGLGWRNSRRTRTDRRSAAVDRDAAPWPAPRRPRPGSRAGRRVPSGSAGASAPPGCVPCRHRCHRAGDR